MTNPFGTWEVQDAAIATLGQPRTDLLFKAFDGATDPIPYLDAAAAAGQLVVLHFIDTVDYARGTVAPSRIKAQVDRVKAHPALCGYLSVEEPSVSHISLAEMRQLYDAYRSADPEHPVVALLGDTPHFGTPENRWGPGVANMLWVDWYPVTFSRGYLTTAAVHFPAVRAYVGATTPGVPIWLLVQCHGDRAGDRRTPTGAELERQVRDGYAYLRADGIVFYTWDHPSYDSDLSRDPTLWEIARQIVGRVRAGTF